MLITRGATLERVDEGTIMIFAPITNETSNIEVSGTAVLLSASILPTSWRCDADLQGQLVGQQMHM